jgi:predicted permease
MAFAPPTDMPINLAIEIDSRVLLYTAFISLITGILFGLAPALQASRASIVTVLKDESARVSGGKGRLRSALVVAQVALSLVLLIAAALFLQSFLNGRSMDTGFDPKNLAISSFDLFPGGYTRERGIIFQKQILQKVESLPGVESAAFARRVPLGFGGSSSTNVAVDGYEPRRDENMSIFYNDVSPRYFQTMSIPILQGREFTEQDTAESRRVVIINETMARRFWPGQDVVGRILRNGGNELEIVGISRDGKYQSLGENPMSFMYFPLAQSYRPEVVLVVRATGNPAALLPIMRETIRSMDSNLPLFDTMTMTEFLTAAVFAQRMAASFLGVFGAMALLLSAVGLYSVIAYSVTRRTHEIGIRMALGAGTGDVLKLVVNQGLKLVMIGTLIGLAASFGVTRLLSSLLYGVSATDPLTFAGISLLLFVVALMACFIPARRAIKIDPMIALRYE